MTSSSVGFNFIKNSVDDKVIHEKTTLKRKPYIVRKKYGLTKFSETCHLACPKFLPSFKNKFEGEPTVFRKKV